ncbi:hypothetical protein [Vulgatibacter incomptus]|uniref:Uncharacterized protein n=1 Tax=Vulgatibacter incomptus TaxID=1391653 RepID=A0A0K1PA67_9BACT|nr:hypothetical protein [Vulgatibacter incomptus]AKU90397.1 hypothetical protein AKJ08_0784 [Vulgatibacter incomptus]
MSSSSRDPRGRFLRIVFLAVHVSIAAVFSLLLIAGVWRGLAEVRPPRAKPALDVDSCSEELTRLRAELLARIAAFSSSASAAAEGRTYEGWVVRFRGRVDGARQRCAPPEGASLEKAKAVGVAFDALVRAIDLSEIHATHWSRHLGPALDESAAAIDAVR